MKTQTNQTSARPRLRADLRRWLQRLGNDVVERKLDASTQQFVREEKYASALIVSTRVARELERPLVDLDRHIACLERLVEREPRIRRVLEALRRDRQAILDALQRLSAIAPPTGLVA